jgi:hypothetical protein
LVRWSRAAGHGEDIRVSCAHSWGGASPDEDEVWTVGSNIGRLISSADRFDGVSGIPLTSAIPVRVTRVRRGIER